MEMSKAMQPPFAEGRYESDGTHHGGPPTSRNHTPTSPSVRSECCAADGRLGPSSGTARLESRSRGEEAAAGCGEGGVTPALGGGSPPAVPI